MKKLFFMLLVLSGIIINTNAQSIPQGMKYQGVARDITGNLMSGREILLKINLKSNLAEPVSHYIETHTITTNEFGLFSVTVGDGAVLSGEFAAVPWSSENIWMEIAVKEKGEADFTKISDSKLLAVPYAFHAATASELINGAEGVSAGVPAQVWTLFGNSNTNPTIDKLGTTDLADLVFVTNNIERLRIQSNGDIKIVNSLEIGKDLTVKENVYLNTVTGQTVNNGPLTVANASATLLTGTLHVNGATDLDNTLNVDGAADFNSTIDVDGAAALHNTLAVDGATDLNSTLNVDGATTLNSTLNVTNNSATTLTGTLGVTGATTLSSTLGVTGATTLSSSLTVAGTTTLNNPLNANGQVTIDADVNGGQGSKSSYPLRVQGSNQGIAITVDGGAENAKNFLTLWDNTGVKGRIEGATLGEATSTFEYIWTNLMMAFQIALPTAEAVACGLNVPPDLAEVASNTAAALVAVANLAAYDIEIGNKYGVAFESGSGDYAEWLEKGSVSETFSYGDVVGVRGGKISKNLQNASHVMVVSMSPIVLGNMPKQGVEQNFEKVAFMGQVPVKVNGVINIGDYIVPSGLNDGFAKGINPSMMTMSDYKNIVGVSWSNSQGKGGFSYVNVAVGINNNDVAEKMLLQQQQIEQMKSEMNRITAYLNSKDASFSNPARNVITPAVIAQPQTRTAATADVSIAKANNLQKMDPTVIKDLMANAKAILDKKGIDYNKFEQTRRMFIDEHYMLQMLGQNAGK
jgi:hypothetical protein